MNEQTLDVTKPAASPQRLEPKIGRDKQNRLVDLETGERVRYVIFNGQIKVPGDRFTARNGREYLVMPLGSLRRLTPKPVSKRASRVAQRRRVLLENQTLHPEERRHEKRGLRS